jgi:elongation factor Ts
MADFSAKDVQALRKATGVGMMDAKRALTENDGDFEKAVVWLREKGLSKAAERADRANEQGAVAIARQGNTAAIVELNCETDFVAKSAEFTGLLDTLAAAVVADGEAAIAAHQDAVDDLRITLKENIAPGRVARFETPEGGVLFAYLHTQSGRGVNAVMVELKGGDEALAKEIALHIAFARPTYLSREDVPAEVVANERQVQEAITRNEGKPEAAVPKIVEGRLTGFFKQLVLLEQDFVKDNKITIGKLVADAGATLTRFAQVEIGR